MIAQKFNNSFLSHRKRLAANVVCRDNPEYIIKDFLSFFPNFENQLDHCIIQNYIDVANDNVNIGRWGKNWKYGMALFIAHLCCIHAQMAGLDSENPKSIANSSVTGTVSSKSVGGVSISYDSGSVLNDLEGWGNFKLTTYGSQFVTMANMVGVGAMVIS